MAPTENTESLFDTAPASAQALDMLDWQPSQADLDFLADMVWEDMVREG